MGKQQDSTIAVVNGYHSNHMVVDTAEALPGTQNKLSTASVRFVSRKGLPCRSRQGSMDLSVEGEVRHVVLDKYLANRTGTEDVAEIGKIFSGFFSDLEKVLPGDAEVLTYMKDLAKFLQSSSCSTREAEQPAFLNLGTTTEQTAEVLEPLKVVLKRYCEEGNSPKLRFTDARPSNPAARLIVVHKHMASVPSTDQLMKSSSSNNSVVSNHSNRKGEKSCGRNMVLEAKRSSGIEATKTPKAVPKLNLKNVRLASQEFNHEFLAKMDEFSESWREEAEAMKKHAGD